MKKYINKETGNIVYAVQAIFDENGVGELDRWALSDPNIETIEWVYQKLGDTHRILKVIYKNGYDQSFLESHYLTKSDKEDCFLFYVHTEDFEKDYQLYSEYATEFFKSTGIPAWYIEPYKDENLNKIPNNTPVPDNTPMALVNELPPFGKEVIVFTEKGSASINALKKSLTTTSEKGEHIDYIWDRGTNGKIYKYWLYIPDTVGFFNKNKNREL